MTTDARVLQLLREIATMEWEIAQDDDDLREQRRRLLDLREELARVQWAAKKQAK